MADRLIGSQILRIAADIRAMIAEGKRIYNLTAGDFNPTEFRIPRFLEANIKEAFTRGETNYPPSDGMLVLRKSVLGFYERWLNLKYPLESVMITGGSRPGIYTTYATLVDPGDIVVYPVPSWNNNHYCYLAGAVGRPVLCRRDNAFLPTAALLQNALHGARLLALNSPLNPTGTAFVSEALEEICDLVLEENARRKEGERPLYVMFDQIYWMLTFGSTTHYNPVTLRPAMAPFTIFIDGISKAFAATGLRVGWVVGPPDVMLPMTGLLGHLGAWAPRAEQVATARLLSATDAVSGYHATMKKGIQARLNKLYTAIGDIRNDGLPVDVIAPMGAIYLSAQFSLKGRRTPSGTMLRTDEDIRRYLLHEAGMAVVPFQAFGISEDTGWFRLSVGAISLDDITSLIPRLRSALSALSE